MPVHLLHPEPTNNTDTKTEELVGRKRKFDNYDEEIDLANSLYPTDIDIGLINTEEIYSNTASNDIMFDDPLVDETKTNTDEQSISNILPEINDSSANVNEIINQFDNEATTLNMDERDFMESLENVPSNKNNLIESIKNTTEELSSTWSNQFSSQEQSLFEANNSNTWASQYNRVDETEEDVAIQSIIDDSSAAKSIDDNTSIDFSPLKLDNLDNSAIEFNLSNNQEIDEIAIVNDKDIDKDKIDNSNNKTISPNESFNFLEQNATNESDDIENESANEIQMRSAIKSLMMSLSSNNVSTNQTSYYTQRNMDNDNYLSNDMLFSSQNFIQDNHHLNHASSMLMNHHVSSSSLSGTTGNMMNTNAYIDTSTSMINDDPMLDEAVKSIL